MGPISAFINNEMLPNEDNLFISVGQRLRTVIICYLIDCLMDYILRGTNLLDLTYKRDRFARFNFHRRLQDSNSFLAWEMVTVTPCVSFAPAKMPCLVDCVSILHSMFCLKMVLLLHHFFLKLLSFFGVPKEFFSPNKMIAKLATHLNS